MTCTEVVCKGIVIERSYMKSTHEEGDIRIQQMVQYFSHYRCHKCIFTLLLWFQYLTHRLSIAVLKSSTVKERSVMIDVKNN